MPGDDRWFDETGEELDDREFPEDDCDEDDFDEDDFDEDHFDDEPTETVPCSHCGAEVYEDAVRCPACGAYVTHDTNVWSGRPGWWILLGLLGILATILALAGFSIW